MVSTPPRLRFEDAGPEEESNTATPPIRPLGCPDNETGKDMQSGSSRLMSVTSAALSRVKGMKIRSGSTGRVLTPRSVTMVSGYFFPSRQNGSSAVSRDHGEKTDDRHSNHGSESKSSSSNFMNVGQTGSIDDAFGTHSPKGARKGGSGDGGGNEQKLSVLFGDDEESDCEPRSDGESTATNDRATSCSKWTSTLMASTLARGEAGKPSFCGGVDLVPRPSEAGNKVEYLIMVCKAAQKYASAQVPRLSRVRDGQHMINQLRDVASDLGRQAEKILAVYDTREVRQSADRLGETLSKVYDLLGDVEGTSIMFGRKRGFGKRVSALVHDIGTRANALLAATSLAIANRPNVLYASDNGERGTPAPQQEALLKMCIKGDKFFFGRGEKPNMAKAFEAYSWAAERGCAEAMHMTAWMYRVGNSGVEADAEKCQLWLERAVEKGYAPAMNDLAATLLGEADRIERAHPELKTDVASADAGTPAAGAACSTAAANIDKGASTGRRLDSGDDDDSELAANDKDDNDGTGAPRGNSDGGEEDGMGTKRDGSEGAEGGVGRLGEDSSPLPPELAQLFEQVMDKRKRSMQLLQDAAKTGHTEAMTNLGNMQEAMGFPEDARSWYSLAALPSESANNPRAQNCLGALFYEGRGVTRDLAEAVKWFRLSARQGFPQACQNLGICYQNGTGVAKDLPKATELFRQAVDGGSITATNNLAYLLARDALHTLAAAARQAPSASSHCRDHPFRVVGTGLQFEDPSNGFMKAAELSSRASSKLWRESTAQLREAADLFRRAADSGIGDASYQLGRLYQQGLGLPLDPVAAFENFLSAADGEAAHPTAAACVGDMLYNGTGCLRDYGAALRYYLRAANAGEASSANAVGLLYELGRGVARDLAAASAWYQRAADLGSADGAFNAALLLERGDPLSALASAAGLPVFRAPYPAYLPSQNQSDRQYGSGGSGGGGGSANSAGNCAGGAKFAASLSQQTLGDGDVGSDPGEHAGIAEREHRRRNEGSNHARQGGGKRAGHHLASCGSRAQALVMFQRAAELGHTKATEEIRRLRVRERMDHLARVGYRSPARGRARR